MDERDFDVEANRPMDTMDRIVLWACGLAAAACAVILIWGR